MSKSIATFLFFLSMAPLMAQHLVTGKVSDATTKETLIGVNILLQSPYSGAVTDANGSYALKIPPGTGDSIRLEASFIGYSTSVLVVKNTGVDMVLDFALGPDTRQLKTVVVTATKKTQDSQRVPMSITTLPSIQLRRSGAKQFRDYASGIANLSFGTQGAGVFGRIDNGISIRGIAGKNTTALYLDETPLPENLDPRLSDINRVEVLKGPQGTLYGSRNMGGAVKMITNAPNPKQIEGFSNYSAAAVKEGGFDHSFEGYFNLPFGKKAALRTVAFYDAISGIFDRKIKLNAHILNLNKTLLTTGPDGTPFRITTDGCPGCYLKDIENVDAKSNYGFQASLGFFPSAKISIVPKVIFQDMTGDGFDFAEGRVGNFVQERVSGIREHFKDNWVHYSLVATLRTKLGKFSSSTSLLDRTILEVDDNGESVSRIYGIYDGDTKLDFFAGNIYKDMRFKQLNQELKFQSDLGGKLEFTLGAFHLSGRTDEIWNSTLLGHAPYIALHVYEDLEYAKEVEAEQPASYDFGGVYTNWELALFGEATYQLTQRLKATLGLRAFDATVGIVAHETGFLVDGEYFTVDSKLSEKGVIPKFNISYELGRNRMVYATVAKGYRLGDANEIVPDVFCGDELKDLPGGKHPRTFDSDFLWNYELGFKTTWADGRLMTNAAIFYNDWQNLQQNRTLDCGYNYTSNVGAAHTTGLELELRAKATASLELGSGLGLLYAVIDESGPHLDAEPGDKILFTPSLTANANAQYTQQLSKGRSIYLRADMQYAGERLNTFSPEDEEEAYKIFAPYAILNARVGLLFKQYEFSIFANNLTNTAANFGDIFSVATDFPSRPRFSTNRPVTVGVQLALKF
ncbi:MAG: TonB-dependent receptor [Saprospiraceae bacterium]|nr:TonB-dependent receptor [Saprospiraceae bacterium]